ncbi:MAG: type I-C CRISPR-associated protein Cas8c/Csd1, partial [Paracoccaceae bacterium]|nr:type I-C CRISPR-associated protein Cas8c/Csd1 [Paracoccaceae bacterium]
GAFMLGNRAVSGAAETISEAQIKANLQRLRDGRPLAEVAPNLDQGVRFHVLGLAPNAARLSVRFYWEDSFGVLARHYVDWMRDTDLETAATRPEFSIRSAVLRTAPAQIKNGKLSFDSEHVSPLLAGELLRAVLTGGRFPRALLGLLIMRIRSDHLIDRVRISLIKAVIVRDMRRENRLPRHPDGSIMEDYLMRSDADDPNPARRLGRLFALIERAQLAALGDDINATVKDKFLGSAAATPARVFPELLRNAENHHLKRLRNGHSDASWITDAAHARRVANGLGREIGQLWTTFPDGPEQQHSNEEQGLFLVGYYQEKYAKRGEAGRELPEATETDIED